MVTPTHIARRTMTRKLRNIGIMAHVDAGKTTLTERILLNTGRIHKAGDVHSGTATTDSHALEKLHGITISAAATSCEWRDASITIIDTPGHVDFTIEVERSLRVLDGAVAVFSAVTGVEAQSETVWRQASRFGVPRLCFINKMDQPGTDAERAVAMIAERLGANPLPVQLPIVSGGAFCGIVDLVAMEALTWDGGNPDPERTAIPPELHGAAARAREAMLETLAECDDAVLAAWLDDPAALPAEAIRVGIRRACLAGRCSPLLYGSAYRNIGVQPLLEAIVDFAPAPEDRPPVEGMEPSGAAVLRVPSPDAPLAALISKVQAGRFGTLAFLRVYSGRLVPGMSVLNTVTGKSERIGRLIRMHADAQEEIAEATAGDVVAAVGLKSVRAGDTLSDPGQPVVLSGFVIPDPVIEAVIEPRTAEDRTRLGPALAMMARGDPSLRVSIDGETGQLLVRGMGELHLKIVVETLKADFNVDATIGEPQVAYRTAATCRAEVDHLLRKQNGGQGQMARVRIAFEPLGEGESGLVFENRSVGGAVPREYVPAIAKAIETALADGGPGGHPVLGIRAILLDGAFHEKDSSALAFEVAAREAFRIGFAKTNPVLLEPVMRVVVATPGDYLGGVIGDLQSRRGQLRSTDLAGLVHEVIAEVPLGEMFNYVGALRSLSQGRASFTMAFERYAPMPARLALETAG
ncbi:elongation factor G [Sphingomonas sp. VL_57B]|jgi:elongation factor G|uniref:elongation factor G n=2 Tax=unclassified Sphingomonas TaxID=196159 RepID=UPI0031F4BA83